MRDAGVKEVAVPLHLLQRLVDELAAAHPVIGLVEDLRGCRYLDIEDPEEAVDSEESGVQESGEKP